MNKDYLKKNLPVITADQFRLGRIHKIFHRLEAAEPQLKLFASYMMVINLTIGDDFYVPTDYIDETKTGATAVWLTLTKKEVKDEQLTTLPQFIAGKQHREEDLTAVAIDSKEGKPLEEVMPLPTSQSDSSEK